MINNIVANDVDDGSAKGNITLDDAAYALGIVSNICTKVGPGLPGTLQERKRAAIIEKELASILGSENVTAEEYTLAPDAFLGSLPVSAIGIIISVLLNIYSVRLFSVPSWIASLGALMLSILSLITFFLEYIKYNEFIDPLFKKKQSVNIIGTLPVDGTKKRTRLLIVSGHHDSALENTWFSILRYGFYITIPTIFFGYLAMVVACSIQLAGTLLNNIRLAQAGTVGWFILLYPVIPSIIFALFFNRGRKNGGTVPGAADNLSACSVVIALCRFLIRHPLNIPPNTEIRFISFGGEEAGLRGSRRYVEKHIEELKNLDARVLNFETIAYSEIGICTSDLNNIKNSPEMVRSVESAALRAGVPFKVKSYPTGGGGSDAAAFSKVGLKALTLLPLKIPQQIVEFYHQKSDTPDILKTEPLLNVLKLALEWVRNGGE